MIGYQVISRKWPWRLYYTSRNRQTSTERSIWVDAAYPSGPNIYIQLLII